MTRKDRDAIQARKPFKKATSGTEQMAWSAPGQITGLKRMEQRNYFIINLLRNATRQH